MTEQDVQEKEPVKPTETKEVQDDVSKLILAPEQELQALRFAFNHFAEYRGFSGLESKKWAEALDALAVSINSLAVKEHKRNQTKDQNK